MEQYNELLATGQRAGLARDFVLLAKANLAGRGHDGNALAYAEKAKMSPRVVDVLKAGPGTLSSDGAWGSELADVRQSASAWLASLQHNSAFDAIVAAGGFMTMPMRTRSVVTSLAGTASQVDEAAVKPVTELSFSGVGVEPLKACAFVVVSDELARLPGSLAERLLDRELRSAVGVATDSVFVEHIISAAGSDPADRRRQFFRCLRGPRHSACRNRGYEPQQVLRHRAA